jgi:hypothetical protein
MPVRLLFASLFTTLCVQVACDGGTSGGDAADAAPAVPIAGRYEVTGTTVERATGNRREIAGTVILAEDGASYTATFHLATQYPVGDAVLPAEVIGHGKGTIDGRTLRGVAETQLVMSTVPGVDPGFAFIPRQTSTRIVSNSVTEIAPDGSVTIDIENQPAEGEVYAPTRTSMQGMRVGASLASARGEGLAAAVPAE